MKSLQNKLAGGVGSLLIMGAFVMPAFAGSTVNISNNESHNSNWVFKDKSAFEDIFDQFFGRKLEATLTGSEEVPGPGDPDGTGEAKVKVKLNKNQLCVDIETKYLDSPTAAHIHHAPKGSAGAVVIPLPKPDEEGKSKGCVDADVKTLEAIKDNPQDYYINIHTNAFPEGAIRGQLSH